MRFIESKWGLGEIELYQELEVFQRFVRPVLRRLRPLENHDLMVENNVLADASIRLVELAYQHCAGSLYPKRPGDNATRLEKTRHNCSVTVLKYLRARCYLIVEERFGVTATMLHGWRKQDSAVLRAPEGLKVTVPPHPMEDVS